MYNYTQRKLIMGVTSLLIKDETYGEIKTQTVTIKHPGGVEVIQYKCDNNWIPESLLASVFHKKFTEEQIHQEIREEAIKKGTFVPEESTNAEYHGDEEE